MMSTLNVPSMDFRMDSPLYFDEIQVGAVWVSPRRTITEADVIQFATMTGDFNPLHVDYDFASKSHYRQPIAHGLLGLSWVAGLGSYFPHVNTLAFTAVRNWEFSRPLHFGDTVFVETQCREKTPSGRRAGKVVWFRKLVNQSDQIVQQGVFETLVATRAQSSDPKSIPQPNTNHDSFRIDHGGSGGGLDHGPSVGQRFVDKQ